MNAAPRSETLYLIDGYASIFRAFYAIRNPLHSPITGEPTNAILVFGQMLLKLYATLRPDYVVVAWDAPGGTFRDALHDQLHAPVPPPEPTTEIVAPPVPGYKGTRRETPDSLHLQTGRILELLELFGVPVIGAPGLEADDVIATITDRVLADPDQAHVRVRIATKDKDLEQLIGDRVSLFDIHTGAELDEAALHAKRGVAPHQIIDYLTLTGDTVDNVPGIAGVGPRIAAKLLQEFGTLDALLEAGESPSVPARIRARLEQARPQIAIARRLVTLERNADIAFTLAETRARPIPTDAMVRFCETLGMNRLREQCLAHAN